MDFTELLKALAQSGPSAIFAGFLLWAGYQLLRDGLAAYREVGGRQAAAIDRLAEAIQAQAPLMSMTREVHDAVNEMRITMRALAGREENK